MVTLIHRHNATTWQVKVTGCKHYMMRQVYRDCSGVKHTDWRRVRKATVEQLEKECVPDKKAGRSPLNTVTPPEPTRTANS